MNDGISGCGVVCVFVDGPVILFVVFAFIVDLVVVVVVILVGVFVIVGEVAVDAVFEVDDVGDAVGGFKSTSLLTFIRPLIY